MYLANLLSKYSLQTESNEVFLGKSLFKKSYQYSETLSKAIDQEIRLIATRAMQEVLDLLEPHRKVIDRLVDTLIEEETINREKFLNITNKEY